MARPATAATPQNIAKAKAMKSEGKAVADIAHALDLPPGTVYRLLNAPDAPTDPIECTLPRTGHAPLRIRGHLVANCAGVNIGRKPDEDNSDWHRISIYQLTDEDGVDGAPTYAVAISYFKDVRGQKSEHHTAHLTDDPGYVLGTYNPLDALIGYPNQPQFAAQQERLEADVQRQYKSLVSMALEQFPEDVADSRVSVRDGELLDIFGFLCHSLRASWNLSSNEAALICDACRSLNLHGEGFRLIPATVEHVSIKEKLATKWECAAPDLSNWAAADLAALAVSIHDFWEKQTDKPIKCALQLAGFDFRKHTS